MQKLFAGFYNTLLIDKQNIKLNDNDSFMKTCYMWLLTQQIGLSHNKHFKNKHISLINLSEFII